MLGEHGIEVRGRGSVDGEVITSSLSFNYTHEIPLHCSWSPSFLDSGNYFFSLEDIFPCDMV